jgi:cytoskeleton protein RodZ
MDVEDSQAEGEQSSINIGARLCEARDNLGLDSEKIAKELNLAVEIIAKIEQNIFHQDIPVAFIRGYLKAYSTKVGLDTPKILAEFDSQTGGDAPSLSRVQIISKFDISRRELNSSSWVIKVISGIVILLFLSYGGYEIWKHLSGNTPNNESAYDVDLASANDDQGNETAGDTLSDSSKNESQKIVKPKSLQETESENNLPQASAKISQAAEQRANHQQAPSSQQESEGALTLQIVESGDIASTDTDVSSKASTDKDITDKDSTTQPLALAQNETTNKSFEMTPLVLDFSADCWVKIVDARGEVIAVGVKRAGKHMPIAGVKPINVVLGDPSVVTLKYDNQDYDLSSYRAEKRAEIILN